MKINIDLIYPIGSIYITTKNISPEILFGGTWQKFSKGRCLMGEGAVENNTDDTFGQIEDGDWTAYAGTTGGEIKHTLSISEMPSHNHKYFRQKAVETEPSGKPDANSVYAANTAINNFKTEVTTYTTGGSNAHNNLPPYVVVYMWERIG